MKPLVICLVVLFTLYSGPARASSVGWVTVVSAVGGLSPCWLQDDTPRIINVYVIHQFMSGASGVQFRVVSGGGFTGDYVDEVSQFPVAIGNSQDGLLVAYGMCLAGPIHVTTITYATYGTSAPCSYLEVVADTASVIGAIEVTTCSSGVLPAPTFGKLQINMGNPLFPRCELWCVLAPVEESTWGRIKSLFK